MCIEVTTLIWQTMKSKEMGWVDGGNVIEWSGVGLNRGERYDTGRIMSTDSQEF
jgi:hypothetical protein